MKKNFIFVYVLIFISLLTGCEIFSKSNNMSNIEEKLAKYQENTNLSNYTAQLQTSSGLVIMNKNDLTLLNSKSNSFLSNITKQNITNDQRKILAITEDDGSFKEVEFLDNEGLSVDIELQPLYLEVYGDFTIIMYESNNEKDYLDLEPSEIDFESKLENSYNEMQIYVIHNSTGKIFRTNEIRIMSENDLLDSYIIADENTLYTNELKADNTICYKSDVETEYICEGNGLTTLANVFLYNVLGDNKISGFSQSCNNFLDYYNSSIIYHNSNHIFELNFNSESSELYVERCLNTSMTEFGIESLYLDYYTGNLLSKTKGQNIEIYTNEHKILLLDDTSNCQIIKWIDESIVILGYGISANSICRVDCDGNIIPLNITSEETFDVTSNFCNSFQSYLNIYDDYKIIEISDSIYLKIGSFESLNDYNYIIMYNSDNNQYDIRNSNLCKLHEIVYVGDGKFVAITNTNKDSLITINVYDFVFDLNTYSHNFEVTNLLVDNEEVYDISNLVVNFDGTVFFECITEAGDLTTGVIEKDGSVIIDKVYTEKDVIVIKPIN